MQFTNESMLIARFFCRSQELPNNQMLKQMTDIMVGWQIVSRI